MVLAQEEAHTGMGGEISCLLSLREVVLYYSKKEAESSASWSWRRSSGSGAVRAYKSQLTIPGKGATQTIMLFDICPPSNQGHLGIYYYVQTRSYGTYV